MKTITTNINRNELLAEQGKIERQIKRGGLSHWDIAILEADWQEIDNRLWAMLWEGEEPQRRAA